MDELGEEASSDVVLLLVLRFGGLFFFYKINKSISKRKSNLDI